MLMKRTVLTKCMSYTKVLLELCLYGKKPRTGGGNDSVAISWIIFPLRVISKPKNIGGNFEKLFFFFFFFYLKINLIPMKMIQKLGDRRIAVHFK